VVLVGSIAERAGAWVEAGSLNVCRCTLNPNPPTNRIRQALALGYGGNPYGPAGTGKTESVKALGAALGRQVGSLTLKPLVLSSLRASHPCFNALSFLIIPHILPCIIPLSFEKGPGVQLRRRV
jgi:hypothetical protein